MPEMLDGERPLRAFLEVIPELSDPTVREIVVNRSFEIGIERATGWQWREAATLDFERLDQIAILAGYQLGKDFDADHPFVYSTLPDGQRFTAVRPPACDPDKIMLDIRRPAADAGSVHDADFIALTQRAGQPVKRRLDMELVGLHRAKRFQEFYPLAVRRKRTIGATGKVFSGKTSFLRRLAKEIPDDERICKIQDAEEFGGLSHRNQVGLIFGSNGVTAEHCAEGILRLRPDRVLMQELRGPETFAFMRVLAAGNNGGMTTWHAEEGDPWTPLMLMAKQHPAARDIPEDKLLALFKSFIDIIVYCFRDPETKQFSTPSVWFRDTELAEAEGL